MNDHHTHYGRLAWRVLGGLATFVGVLVFGATPAFAVKHPEPFAPAPVHAHTAVIGGMPGWQITLIAVAAAVLAAVLAVALDRARTARQQVGATTA
jgi:hypothetical protein